MRKLDLRNLSCLLLLVLFLQLAACEEQDADDVRAQAQHYRAQGEAAASIITLKQALLEDPENAGLRLDLGQIYFEIRDLAGAEKELLRARDYGAAAIEYIEPLSKTWLLQRRFARVLREVPIEAGDERLRAVALVAHGRALAGLDDQESAREHFVEATKADPSLVDAWIESARLAIAIRDESAANDALARLYEIAPDNLEARALRGDLFLNRGELQSAATEYRAILEKIPGHLRTRIALATALVESGELEAALRLLEETLERFPAHPDANYLRALVAARQGRLPTALAHAEKVLIIAPGHLPSVLLAGVSELASGRLSSAERYFLQYLSHSPADETALRLLSVTRQRIHAREQGGGSTALIDDSASPTFVAANRDPALRDREVLEIALPFLAAVRADGGDVALATARDLVTRESAEVALPRLLELHAADLPEASVARPLLGEAYLLSRMPHSALAVVQPELLGNSDNAAALMVGAAASLLTGAGEGAQQILKSLADSFPDDAGIRHLLSIAYSMSGKIELAETSATAAQDLGSGYAPATAQLSRLALSRGNLDQAERHLDRLAALWPERAERFDLEGGLALLHGELDAAAQSYKKAFELEPSSMRAARLAYVEERAGRSSESLALLEDWQRRSPKDLDATLALANKYLRSEQLIEAAESYAAVLQQVPNHMIALNNLAWVSLRLGDIAAARTFAERALELSPDDPRVLDTLGEVLLSEGNSAEALRHLRRAANLGDPQPGLRFRLARALAAQGEIGEAREMLQNLLETDTAFPERQEAQRFLDELRS